MRISINLATRPFADLGPSLKRLRITMAVLAVVAIGLGLGLHALHSKAEAARAREHSLDGDIARITNERQGYETMMRQPDNAQVLDESAALNKLFDEKGFSWTLAMEDLETVLPGGVQVTTLEPTRAKNGDITLHLRVIGPRDKAVDLVQNLEHSRRFLHPRIGGESAETNGAPGQRLEPVSTSNRVNFEVLAEYNPAASSERKSMKKTQEKENSNAPSAIPSHRAGGSSTNGPGLRRPPSTGTARPPANPKPRAGERQ
jgi:type IV pilus assembly protein PilN